MVDSRGDATYDPTGIKVGEAVAPLRELVDELVEEAQATRQRAGRTADANSPAMREFASQEKYAGEWSADPLRLAQSLGGLCLAAAEDHLQAMVTLLTTPPGVDQFRAPVFAHLTLARAVVE